jgi:uncharacterized GH25 family protein
MRVRTVVLAMFVGVLACSPAWAEPTARLAGKVTSAGAPVAGATVMMNRAWPIKGLAYYCPGCYLDCGKSARTNERGEWEVGRLDDALKFELLVVAKGYAPKRTKVFDPSTGAPADVEMVARDTSEIPIERVVRGRVLDADGNPVVGAVVSPEMVYTDDGGCGGLCEGLDELDVTDGEGRFALTYAKACRAMDLAVSARGYAHACFPARVSGSKEHELRVGVGVSVQGRLERDGSPVRDVEVTLATLQRGARGPVCYDRQVIATGKNGEFLFVNVLPGQSYVVTASTKQLGSGCVVPTVVDLTKPKGDEVDAGVLRVGKGVRVSGRLVAEDGGGLPGEAKLSLSSQMGWDGVTLDVGPDGRFEFPEVAPGEFAISLAAKGAYVSHRNASADKVNGGLVGRVEADITGLEVAVTRTQPQRPRDDDAAIPGELGGVEGAAGAAPAKGTSVESGAIGRISGRVVWEGKPLAGTVVMVSSVKIGGGTAWVEHHRDDKQWTVADADGKFQLALGEVSSAWLVLVGPEGQALARLTQASAGEREFALEAPAAQKEGSTCRVRVVDGAGRPVAGALVVPTQLVSGANTGWSGDLAGGARRTGAEGEARVGMPAQSRVIRDASALGVRVVAEGYAPRDVSSIAFDDAVREVVLDAGATLRGTLRGPDGPVEGALIDLMPAVSAGDRGMLRRQVRTDAKGVFVFEHLAADAEMWVSAPAWGNAGAMVGGPVTVRTPAANGTIDAGVLELRPGRVIAGRVTLDTDGGVPKGSWVTMSHEGAWLAWTAPVGESGEFSMMGVPDGGPYLLTLCAPGHMMSLDNAAASRRHLSALRGMVTRDHPAMEVRAMKQVADRERLQPRNEPMRGVEGLSAKE